MTKFLWSNPHSLVYFDVKDDKGKVVHWVGETGSPSAMILIGWEKASVRPGDVITVYIYPSKEGNPAGRLNRLVLADGTVLHDTQLGGRTAARLATTRLAIPKATRNQITRSRLRAGCRVNGINGN